MNRRSRPASRATNVTARVQAAVGLQRAGKLDEAEHAYRALLESYPRQVEALGFLALLRWERGDEQDAMRLFEQVLAIAPGAATHHHNYGVVLRQIGRMEDSERHLRQAIELAPDYAEAYHNYVIGHRLHSGDPLISGIDAALSKPGLSDADRCFLHFAAGKFHADSGDDARAFRHYAQANSAKGVRYSLAADARQFAAIQSTFGPGLFARLEQGGNPSRVPIFVVGMPRSGTTLVEQILASHAGVFGAGELRDMMAIAGSLPATVEGDAAFPHCMEALPTQVLDGMARGYLRRVQTLAPDAERVVDKFPQNFLLLGLIALMFPRARIVHCERSALDTCLSCYFQNFTRGQDYSYDLTNLGGYYQLYAAMMEHWRSVLPVPVHALRYEELTADPEATVRRLFDFCGLEWDPACLEFFETRRTVRTASVWQVRQPIYRSSVARWRSYEQELAPLIKALGPLADTSG